jgi:hypothetical protein
MENIRRIAVAILICLSASAAAPAADKPTLAVLPFEINDTSGEVGGPSRHDAMLAGLTRVVSRAIADSELYTIVPEDRVADAVARVNPGTFLRACNGCELDIARKAGADQVLIGWIWKVSTLIGTLHIEIKDVATGRTVYARVFDFRGDNEKAWQRAATYMVGTLTKAVAPARSGEIGQ